MIIQTPSGVGRTHAQRPGGKSRGCLPPPPLGRPRKKDAQLFDPALCDTELVDVRGQFTQGRWAPVRSLLAATGDDWDRRGHRVVVLAQTPAATAWAREWLLAEPESADAATLLACAGVFTALRGKGSAEAAEQACAAAAARVPADPTPWLGLLLLAGAFGTSEEFSRNFDQVRARHQEHHHAHHVMVARLAESAPPAATTRSTRSTTSPPGPPRSPRPTPRSPSSPSSRTPSGTAYWPPRAPPPTPPRTGPAAGPARSCGPPSTGGSNGSARTTRATAST